METTQTNLLCAVRDAGNKEAWHRFYRIYAPMLFNFTRRLGLPDADCDDVTQDVLMIAHKSLSEGVYDPAKGRFRNWLYGITKKRALMALRARRRPTRVQSISREGRVDLLDELQDDHDQETARKLWEQEWKYALLDEALRHVQGQIGEKVFQAFNLYALERCSVDTVAARLGISASSVYVYKYRVLAAIRDWVSQYDDKPVEEYL